MKRVIRYASFLTRASEPSGLKMKVSRAQQWIYALGLCSDKRRILNLR
jgi:hypothetical protein